MDVGMHSCVLFAVLFVGGGPQLDDELTPTQQRIVDVIGEVCVDGVVGGFDSSSVLLLQTELEGIMDSAFSLLVTALAL